MSKQTFTPKQRTFIYEMFNGHCAYCGMKVDFSSKSKMGFVVEHIIPERIIVEKVKFYPWWLNLAPSCARCNNRKMIKSISEFRAYMLQQIRLIHVFMENHLTKAPTIRFYFERYPFSNTDLYAREQYMLNHITIR
jgi:hypothetical protein